MSSIKFRGYSGGKQGISLPDMTSFAGVIFLMVCFYAITSRFKAPQIGNVALEELPSCVSSPCMPENAEAIIGLDTDGRYSFSVSGPLFQSITIQKVGITQGIAFSALQRSKLNQIDYLDVDIRALPAILERQSDKQSSLLIRKLHPLGEKQLVACLMTSKRVIQILAHKPSYVALLINAETSASKVMHLIDLLQAQGINRYNLKLQDSPQYVSNYR